MAILNKIDGWVEKIKNTLKKRPYLIVVVLIIYLLSSSLITDIWIRHMEFNGIVEDVTYNIKGFPTVTINGKRYDIAYGSYSFAAKIEKGDKMIKKRGEIKLLVIKANTKDTIDFTKSYQNK